MLVLFFLREEDEASKLLRMKVRFLHVRVWRMRYSPARIARHQFVPLSRLVTVYACVLPPKVIIMTKQCAIRILETRWPVRGETSVVCANIFLEKFVHFM